MCFADKVYLEIVASSLYDGGWRSSDEDQLVSEYGFTDSEVSTICYWLSRYAREE